MTTSDADQRRDRARTVLGLFAFAWLLPAFVGGYSLLTMFEFHALPVEGFVPEVHQGLARFVFDPWQHWDGQWFLRIADTGYAPGDASTAFLPAYPWLVRTVAHVIGGKGLVAACLVSWAALFASLVLLVELLEAEIGRDDARLALVLLVAFPTAFYFHAAYTESLFLLLTAGALVAARRGLWVVAAGAALVATLTRWTGVALVPALLIEAWSQAMPDQGKVGVSRWASLFSPPGIDALRKSPRLPLFCALVPLAALPLVLRLFEDAVGDAWAFQRAQRLWERRMEPPWVGLIDGIRVLLPGHPPYLEPLSGGFPRLPDYPGGFLEAHAYNLAAALFGLWLAVVAVRRLSPSFAVLALAGVVIPLMTPSRLQPLQSMPRFVVVLFPLFAALALLLRNRPLLSACTIAAFAAIQGFFISRFALWFWVA